MKTTEPTKVPAIPVIPTNVTPELAAYLKQLSEAVDIRLGRKGDPRDRAVTVRELEVGGVVQQFSLSSIDGESFNTDNVRFETIGIEPAGPVERYDPPAAPTGFTVSQGFSTNTLLWDSATYTGHAFTEVWRHTSDLLGDATLINIVPGRSMIDDVGGGTTYYYWIRHVSGNATLGPFNSQSGTAATTVTNTNFVLNVLAGAVTSTELANNLSSRIDLIDATDSNGAPVAGTLPAQINSAVAAEASNRGTAISNAVADLASQTDLDLKESIANVDTIKTNLQSQINDLNNIPAWDTNDTYALNDQVIYQSNIYRALGTTQGDQPDTTPASWSLLGAYTSLASVVDANTSAITQLNLVDSSSTSATAQLLHSLNSSVDTIAGTIDGMESPGWDASKTYAENDIVRAGLFESVEWAYSGEPDLLSYDISERALRLQDQTDVKIGMTFYAFPVTVGNTYEFTYKYKADRAKNAGSYVRVYGQSDTSLPAGKAFISHNANISASEVEEDDSNGPISPTHENLAVTTSFQTRTSTYTPSGNTDWASIVVLNWLGMDDADTWSSSFAASTGYSLNELRLRSGRKYKSLSNNNSSDPLVSGWEDLGAYTTNGLYIKDVSVIERDSSNAVVKEWDYKSRVFRAKQAHTTRSLHDTSYWEDLGSGDLSNHIVTTNDNISTVTANLSNNYYTSTEADQAISAATLNLASSSDIPDVSSYITSADLPDVSGFVTNATLTTDYYTSSQADQAISTATQNLASSSDIPDVSSYITSADLPDLSGYVTNSTLTTNYYTSTQADQAISTATQNLASSSDIPDTSGFLTSADLPDTSNFVTNSTLSTNHYTKTQADSAISSSALTLVSSVLQSGFISKNNFEDEDRGNWSAYSIQDAPAGHPLGRTKALNQTGRDLYFNLPGALADGGVFYQTSAHGRTFRVTGYVYNSSAVVANAGLNSRNASSGQQWDIEQVAPANSDQWVYYDQTFTVNDPDGTRFRPFLQLNGFPPAAFNAYWTDMTLTEVIDATIPVVANPDGTASTVALEVAAETQADINDGLKAQYTVKVDNNGHVAGYGLATTTNDDTPTSEFIVNADSFAITHPSYDLRPANITPWVVGHDFVVGDIVKHSVAQPNSVNNDIVDEYYICIVDHTAADPYQDFAAGYWQLAAASPFQVTTARTVNYQNSDGTSRSVTIPGGVYMNTAHIAVASISSAQIGIINADQITTGKLNASLIETGTLDVGKINMQGTSTAIDIKSSDTGSRMEIASTVIKIFDGTQLRVQIGDLTV